MPEKFNKVAFDLEVKLKTVSLWHQAWKMGTLRTPAAVLLSRIFLDVGVLLLDVSRPPFLPTVVPVLGCDALPLEDA